MLVQTRWDHKRNWNVRPLVDASEEFRELLGEEVLALVGGRVRKRGEDRTYTTERPDEAVRKYILDCLVARGVAIDPDVKVIVIERKRRELAEFEVLWPDGSHKGYYQASIVIARGLD